MFLKPQWNESSQSNLKLYGAGMRWVKGVEQEVCVSAGICRREEKTFSMHWIETTQRTAKQTLRLLPPWGKNWEYICLKVSSFTTPLGHSWRDGERGWGGGGGGEDRNYRYWPEGRVKYRVWWSEMEWIKGSQVDKTLGISQTSLWYPFYSKIYIYQVV